MSTSSVIRLVRKLLALTKSPNKHEAESAALEAEKLMAKHNLKDEDVADSSTVILDEHADDFRKDLARGVLTPIGLPLFWNRSGEIATKGVPKIVDPVVALYHRLRDVAEANAIMPRFELPFPEEARPAWRAFYLSGFAAAVAERLVVKPEPVEEDSPATKNEPVDESQVDWGDGAVDDGENGNADEEHRFKPAPPKMDRQTAETRSPVREMIALHAAKGHLLASTLRWFCDKAFESGKIAGDRAVRDLPVEPVRLSQLMLSGR